jgi:hypothetical protein
MPELASFWLTIAPLRTASDFRRRTRPTCYNPNLVENSTPTHATLHSRGGCDPCAILAHLE